MDSFDKLIVNKVDQTQLHDVDQAWNDFVKYRDRHVVTPKKTSWIFSKISLGIIAVLLLFVGAVGGYQFARQEINSTVSGAETPATMNVDAGVRNRSFNPPLGIAAKKASDKAIVSQNTSEKSVVVPIFASSDKLTKEVSVNVERSNPSVSFDTLTSGELFENSLPTAVVASNTDAFKTTTAVEATQQNPQIIEQVQPLIAEVISPEKVETIENNNQEAKTVEKEKSNAIPDSQNQAGDNSPALKSPAPSNNAIYYNTGSYAGKGSVRKGKRFNMKEYLSVFNRYTDMSFYSLENSNDITTEMNAKFMINPAKQRDRE